MVRSAGWAPDAFLCSERHELGEELVPSYLYQLHLYYWLETNDYGRFLSVVSHSIKYDLMISRVSRKPPNTSFNWDIGTFGIIWYLVYRGYFEALVEGDARRLSAGDDRPWT